MRFGFVNQKYAGVENKPLGKKTPLHDIILPCPDPLPDESVIILGLSAWSLSQHRYRGMEAAIN